MARVKVRFNRLGLEELQTTETAKWLVNDILIPAERDAKREVNVDTGNLRSGIYHRVQRRGDTVEGVLEAIADYAVWQETEPGDVVPGYGVRVRRGGKPFLRPAIFRQLQRILG